MWMLRFVLAAMCAAPLAVAEEKPKDAAPEKQAKNGAKVVLVGTSWKVTYPFAGAFEVVYVFAKDGVFHCGKRVTGTWKQDQSTVQMKSNDGAYVFDAAVKGDAINGKVRMTVKGKTYRYEFKGKKFVPEQPEP